MPRYCPICGKSDSQSDFYGELCLSCAKERTAHLPPARVKVCSKCGAVMDKARRRKEWDVEEEAARLLHLRGKNPKFCEGMSSVFYDAPSGRIEQSALVLFEKSICVDCGRAGSQYFEAIIQLRGKPEKVARMAGRLCRRLERRTFIPKLGELKEGVDIYCGSRNEAIAALNSFQLGFLRTEKLAGERNGKRLYRTTLLVRL